jgi:uncharacterized protein (DUF924 family)
MDNTKILEFWFPNDKFQKFWFSNKFDEYIKNEFNDMLIYSENNNNIPYTCEDLLCNIILLDQFTRNIYRGSNKMYKNDTKALQLANIFFKLKYDTNIKLSYLIFALMPFRHSENLEDQKFVVNKIKSFKIKNKDKLLYNKFLNASNKSYDIIFKYGKFVNRYN